VNRACSFVVAGSPAQFTGGYLYDARIAQGLTSLGWQVQTHGLEGRFPLPDARAAGALAQCLAAHPDGACVVIDGLVFGGLPEVVRDHAHRLDLVALVHHPLAEENGLDASVRDTLEATERAALAHARRVVVTSGFTARQLADYAVPPGRIHVVEPGVDPSTLAAADHEPPRLLCIASIVPRKGHLVLIEALTALQALPWSCTLVGSADRDRAHAGAVTQAIAAAGLSGRITLTGELPPARLQEYWLGADLFVLPSFYEGYGMVVTEAIAHGLPVLTTRGGALAETLPPGAGVLVSPGDAKALADALGQLLRDGGARATLRTAAREARGHQGDWMQAARAFAAVLEGTPP
jgi:glycosyltransferase involved in cell wall biosynthesis